MIRRLALAAMTAALALAAAGPAAAATSVTCTGEASVVPVTSSIQVRQLGPLTVTSFDFTGTHSFCDRMGRRVEGGWSGHLVQTVLPSGRTLLSIRGHEEFDGATIDVAGLISISPSGTWNVVHARAGNGTGWLKGATSNIREVFPTATPGVLGFRSIITWR